MTAYRAAWLVQQLEAMLKVEMSGAIIPPGFKIKIQEEKVRYTGNQVGGL